MKVVATLIFILLISKMLTLPLMNYFQIVSLSEPELKTYSSDEISFLKMFYLMEKGEGYYEAFKIARENMAYGNLIQSDIFTWRMPTVFYLWKVCCNDGEDILSFFIFLSLTTILLVYLMFKKLVNKWAMSVLVIFPYFYDTFSYKSAFLFTEWWGILFFIVGLYGISGNFSNLAMMGFFLAMATRELFVIPIIIMLVFAFITKQKVQVFLLSLIGFLLLYVFHVVFVNNVVNEVEGKIRFIERFKGYSLENLQVMISFSMRSYVINGLKTHYLVLFLGICSLIYGVIFTKMKVLPYLLLSIISFLVILPIISVKENDYWGIMFVPLILLSIPVILMKRSK